jgi:hypothetical protein
MLVPSVRYSGIHVGHRRGSKRADERDAVCKIIIRWRRWKSRKRYGAEGRGQSLIVDGTSLNLVRDWEQIAHREAEVKGRIGRRADQIGVEKKFDARNGSIAVGGVGAEDYL